MSSYLRKLVELQKINTPTWLPDNVMFEGLTGSVAYGVSNDTSDMDIIGFCIPPKNLTFPHLVGEIPGFGTQIQRFEQYQEHHIVMPEWKKTFDITIYSIVKFFQLAMENNPNMVDALFLPRRCVVHSTAIYETMRENRNLFLHKGSWHKFKGYAYSQFHKIETKVNRSNPKRAESIEKFGYDVKFAYHVVRLILEAEQILTEHDLDLERNSALLRAVRSGEWSLDRLKVFLYSKEKDLDDVYNKSSLRYKPNESAIKELLLNCMEMHYGKIATELHISGDVNTLIAELKSVMEKYEK